MTVPGTSRETLFRPTLEGDGERERAETVLCAGRIAGLLSAIAFPPLVVNVAIPGVAGLYSSALLQVNSAGKRILLDALSPAEGHLHIAPGTMLHIHSRLRGVQLDFATRVIELRAGDRPPTYLARMPGSIRCHQRRDSPRIRTGKMRDYSVVTLGPGAGHIRGRLADLSVGGLRVVLPRDPGIVPGQILPGCRISLLGEDPLDCTLEFAHRQRCALTGELEAGARFVRGEHHDEPRLQRLLDKLQREQLEDPSALP